MSMKKVPLKVVLNFPFLEKINQTHVASFFMLFYVCHTYTVIDRNCMANFLSRLKKKGSKIVSFFFKLVNMHAKVED